jgi:hypothetical protein
MTWLFFLTGLVLVLAMARLARALRRTSGPLVDDSDIDDEQEFEPPPELLAQWQQEWLVSREWTEPVRRRDWLSAPGQRCASAKQILAFKRSMRRQSVRRTREVWLHGRQHQGRRRHGRAPRRAAARTRPTTSSPGARSEPPGGDPPRHASCAQGHVPGDAP